MLLVVGIGAFTFFKIRRANQVEKAFTSHQSRQTYQADVIANIHDWLTHDQAFDSFNYCFRGNYSIPLDPPFLSACCAGSHYMESKPKSMGSEGYCLK